MFLVKISKNFSHLFLEVYEVLHNDICSVVSIFRVIVQKVLKEGVEPFEGWFSLVQAGKQNLVLFIGKPVFVEFKKQLYVGEKCS